MFRTFTREKTKYYADETKWI